MRGFQRETNRMHFLHLALAVSVRNFGRSHLTGRGWRCGWASYAVLSTFCLKVGPTSAAKARAVEAGAQGCNNPSVSSILAQPHFHPVSIKRVTNPKQKDRKAFLVSHQVDYLYE